MNDNEKQNIESRNLQNKIVSQAVGDNENKKDLKGSIADSTKYDDSCLMKCNK